MITIGFNQDLTDVMAFQRHFALTNKHLRKSVNLMRYLFPALLLAFAAIITEWDSDPVMIVASLLPAVVIALVWVVFMPKWYIHSVMRKTRKIMTEPENAKLFGFREMMFDEEGVKVKTSSVDETIKWSGFVQWDETERYYFLYVASNNAFCVPKSKLKPEESDALRSLFHTYIQSKR